jgi:transcriptional regulator with XRE-family HTH domain
MFPLSDSSNDELSGDMTLELGAAMRYHRIANGVSLRVMARRLGFSGHSHLADYERGRRLPGREIVTGYEEHLRVPPGQLGDIYDRALTERAKRLASEPIDNGDEPSDSAEGVEGLEGGYADGPMGIRLEIQLPCLREAIELEIRLAYDEGRRRR